MFNGEPPTKALKPDISLNGTPMSWEYKSIDDLPIAIKSRLLIFAIHFRSYKW